MGLQDDLRRYRQVGEKRRQDLSEFIKHSEFQAGHGEDAIRIPVKIIDLPEFEYGQIDKGGVGSGDGDVGDPVPVPPPEQDGDGDGEGDEAGEGTEEHGYYQMDPEKFAQELDRELGLDLEPKGKQVAEITEGDYNDLARTGPQSTIAFEPMFKQALKRHMAMALSDGQEEYIREVLRVRGYGPQKVFEWARGENLPVSLAWIEKEYSTIPSDEKTLYDSIEDVEEPNSDSLQSSRALSKEDMANLTFRSDDERHRHPEVKKEYEKNVVIVNIRDVSGSMRDDKRKLVEKLFTPMDWYLSGKYDNAEFIYIAHDTESWEVEREDFFGIQSGGGTKISSAYELAANLLEQHYPWKEWNRYVFGAGDGENLNQDTEQNLIPSLTSIPANLHAYVEANPGGSGATASTQIASLAEELNEMDNGAFQMVSGEDDILDAIYAILSTEDNE